MTENGPLRADSERPRGWVSATLDELGTWTGGGTPKKSVPGYWDGDLAWVSPKDMKSIRLIDTQDHITKSAVEASAAKTFPANSIAIVVRSGILEHTLPIALVPFHATANQDMKILTPHPGVNPEWLLYALLAAAPDVRERCRKHGTTVASIDFPKLRRYPLGVPPRAEQDRIVDRLETLLRDVSEGDDECNLAEIRLTAFRSSVLQQFVGRDEREVPIGELGDVFVGATPPRDDPDTWGGDIPWVSSGEVAFCRIKRTRETITEAGLGNRARRLHPPGTVLLAMIGEGKTRGQAAILDVAAAHNQNSAAIRPDPDKMVPEFLYYCLMARYDSNRLRAGGSQQPALSGARVRELQVPCPPLEQQRDIVRSIEESLAALAGVERDIAMRRRNATQLKRSLLSQASSGTLVPQHASVEPAQVEGIAP